MVLTTLQSIGAAGLGALGSSVVDGASSMVESAAEAASEAVQGAAQAGGDGVSSCGSSSPPTSPVAAPSAGDVGGVGGAAVAVAGGGTVSQQAQAGVVGSNIVCSAETVSCVALSEGVLAYRVFCAVADAGFLERWHSGHVFARDVGRFVDCIISSCCCSMQENKSCVRRVVRERDFWSETFWREERQLVRERDILRPKCTVTT